MAVHATTQTANVQTALAPNPNVGPQRHRGARVVLSPDSVAVVASHGPSGRGFIPDPGPTNALYAQSDTTQ